MKILPFFLLRIQILNSKHPHAFLFYSPLLQSFPFLQLNAKRYSQPRRRNLLTTTLLQSHLLRRHLLSRFGATLASLATLAMNRASSARIGAESTAVALIVPSAFTAALYPYISFVLLNGSCEGKGEILPLLHGRGSHRPGYRVGCTGCEGSHRGRRFRSGFAKASFANFMIWRQEKGKGEEGTDRCVAADDCGCTVIQGIGCWCWVCDWHCDRGSSGKDEEDNRLELHLGCLKVR